MSDDKLFKLLKVERPETFWAAQKARIMDRVRASRPAAPWWVLAPALAGALALTVFWRGEPRELKQGEVPPQAEWALLEQLDLLEDLDTVEALGETDA